VNENWRKHLADYSISETALFDLAFLDRWGDRTWYPAEADKRASAELHTAISSRIATQRLEYLEGIEVGAGLRAARVRGVLGRVGAGSQYRGRSGPRIIRCAACSRTDRTGYRIELSTDNLGPRRTLNDR
jgi:hypothetical protein